MGDNGKGEKMLHIFWEKGRKEENPSSKLWKEKVLPSPKTQKKNVWASSILQKKYANRMSKGVKSISAKEKFNPMPKKYQGGWIEKG